MFKNSELKYLVQSLIFSRLIDDHKSTLVTSRIEETLCI